jgi:hypothetical protein
MPKNKPTRLKNPIAGQRSIDRMAADVARDMQKLSASDLANMDREIAEAFPGGFTERDEANALIAMAVRNGPIEDLHAGKYSPLLEDDSLSRITDEEMRVVLIHATRVLASLLRLRDVQPDVYRRWIATYGRMHCYAWERDGDGSSQLSSQL